MSIGQRHEPDRISLSWTVIPVKNVAVVFPVASKTIPPDALAYLPVPIPVVVVDGIHPLTS
jgi:hypothetical protein